MLGVIGNAELAQAGKTLGGERFIDLDHIKVSDLQAQARHQLAGRRHRTHSHHPRRDCRRRHAENAGARLEPVAFGGLRAREHHRRCPVIDARCIARGHRSRIAGVGLELGKRFERGLRAWMLVLIDNGRTCLAARSLDRHDLLGEIASRNGIAGALLRAQGKGILVRARDLILFRHVLGSLRHGVDAVLRLEQGIDEAPAQRRISDLGAALERLLGLAHDQRSASHGLNAPCDRELGFAATDGARGIADRIESRGAQPVHGHPWHAIRDAGQEQRHAGHVAIVLARLVGAAEHHLIELGPVDVGMALDQGPDRDGGKVIGAHTRERAAIAPDGGAHRIADENLARFAHALILALGRLAMRARRAGMQRAQYAELMFSWGRRLRRISRKAHGPASVCPDRVRRDAGMNRGHCHLLGDGVRLIHREIGNKSGRPLVPDTEACALVASLP